MIETWFSDELKIEIIKVFEPRYRCKLSDEEILIIADNLTGFMETKLKFKWRKHEDTFQNSK